ncbi:thiamine phosphate synthase [Poriferisphaera sp. WC338]|uniref:thiamine phosphate synthase n=1 Tax=Poriferisphaera sp. WC338 TaxID=3425129 RepID=UPI003D81A39A
MPNVKRIIDANANRVREALRVMEESARFLLGDAKLCEQIKSLRHDFAASISQIDGLEANRDTTGDVGTQIKTVREYERESADEVVIAASKRLSEALRAIEEYSKVLGDNEGAKLPSEIEQLRYRGYAIEQKLNMAMGSMSRKQWKLCLLLTKKLCKHHAWNIVLRKAIAGGVDCVQVREKEMESGELLAHAREVVQICHDDGVAVVVNDRPDVAMLAGADGVHVGQGDLPVDEVRRLVGRQLLVGVSTSCIEDAKRGLEMGADYCGVGPMYPTTTKEKKVIVGPGYLRKFIEWGGLPGVAIGGIETVKVSELVKVGCKGVAVSSVICGAEKPGEVAREIVKYFCN